MLKVDKAILDVNDVICKNIDAFWNVDRGLLSQNILSQVRTLVEYVAIKEHSHGADIDPYNESENKLALREIASRGDMRFLNSFHKMLQKSVSHYTFDKDGSERLMLKYYEHLLKLRKYVKESFGLDILENINDFPLNTDKELLEYYEKIASKIEETKGTNNKLPDGNRFYIQRIKPFFINQKIYYEITFTAALGNVSKFDRVIAFTDLEINSNYAVRFSLHSDSINILDKDMSILIIDDYEVSIRPCELNNLARIIGIKEKYNVTTNEYRAMMKHLKKTKMSLTELVTNEESYYQKVKTEITTNAQSIKIYKLLDKCREIIQSDKPGKNVLSYLLYRMNNRIIKFQISIEQCEKLSGLYLNYGCIPFDNMPFCSSLAINNSYDEKAVVHAIAKALENFYGSLIEKIDDLDIVKVMKRKNPYLYRAKAMQNASEIVDSVLSAFVSSSEETIFGNCFFEPIAIAASGGNKALAEGIDIMVEKSDLNIIYAVAVKSGPSVFNADSKKRQEQNFIAASKLAQQAKARYIP